MQSSIPLGEKSQAIIDRDSAVMSGSIVPRYPFVIERGSGARVWDVEGKEYIDLAAGIAVTSTGHSHPNVVKAIQDQAEKFIHIAGTDYYYDVQVRLAEKLAQLAPFDGDARVFLTNSGTEAIEGALKLARWYTGRSQIIGFFGSFHGRSMGALSLTSSKIVQRKGFAPLIPGVHHVPYNNPYRCGHNRAEAECHAHCTCANYIETMLFQRTVDPHDVAAIVLESIQGEGGYVVPDARFVQELRDLCDRYGIVLIVDEVQSGIGRTGKWWAIEHFGVQPDIVCSAKGIASGMPLGAIIARAEIMSWEVGAHGSTYGGNPICCAAALATLDLIESEYMANAHTQGAFLMDALEEMRSHHPTMRHARIDGKGLMVGVELVLDEARTPAKAIRNDAELLGIDEGVLILGAGTSSIRFCPALMIDEATLSEGLQRFDRALTRAEQAAGL